MKLFIVLLLIFGILGNANATLTDMGDGTVYDTDLQLTWLKDANYAEKTGYNNKPAGLMTWYEALEWADTLTFAGFNDWRLPTADLNCPAGSYNCSNGEMGHLYYTELRNEPALGGEAPPLNPGPFTNLEKYGYWANTGPPYGQMVWVFNFSGGGQGLAYEYEMVMFSWAVREGERSTPVPEPSTMLLLGSGLIGLIGFRKKFRK